ncbi:PREDICTED: muscle-related coiled-coil protein [Nanorana parkeri]|uniref:muscle-related coiled-coil protein n=1 Tax=Nanorana parkeri TaxID=125878 RepID=UPI0008546508|nr:PREDICTED: muscle-related coiled-coil protein [Nanorana parkeri]
MDHNETTPDRVDLNRLSVVSEDDEDHESALTIVSVLDRVATIVDTVQESQKRIEERHREMENAIKTIQIDLLKLAQAHSNTSYTVNKLLEKTRKVSTNVKDVRSRVDRQSDQVQKVESKQEEMLRKNKFRVVIFQEDIECPTKLTVAKESALDGYLKDKLYSPNDLSSDEEYEVPESRASRLKKSGMQRIDNIKKAFSKESMQKTQQNFGKKVNRIRTRIVTPERRERIRQSGERLKQSGERFKQSIAKASPKKDTFKLNKKKKEKERTTAEGQENGKDDEEESVSEDETVKPISEVTYTEVVTVKKKKNSEKAELLPAQDEEKASSVSEKPLLKLETKLDTDETPLVDIKLS